MMSSEEILLKQVISSGENEGEGTNAVNHSFSALRRRTARESTVSVGQLGLARWAILNMIIQLNNTVLASLEGYA